MTSCPLCGGTVAKFTVSFHAEFTMCSNEDCIYPFQDDTAFKASVDDKRPPTGHGLSKKRKATLAPNGVQVADTKSKMAKKSKSNNSEACNVLENSPSTILSKSDISNCNMDTAMQKLGILLPPSKSAQPIDNPAPATNRFTSIPSPSATISTASSPTTQPLMPTSPEGIVPDLVFDFLPTEGWITPVTPPDNPSSADIVSKVSTTGSTALTANSLETLLFDDDFDIDFGTLQNMNPTLVFDADFEAILNQQL